MDGSVTGLYKSHACSRSGGRDNRYQECGGGKTSNPTGKKGRSKKVTILEEKPATEANKPDPQKEGRKKDATAHQDESSATQDENAAPKEKKESFLTIPTCLDPRVLHEDPKVQESRLKTRKNCLQGFVHRYASELKQLEDRGLFAGEVKDYNKEVMEILVDIFTLKKAITILR